MTQTSTQKHTNKANAATAKRVALIINNPVRDLAAMLLLGHGLCQEGLECFLVPLSIKSREIWALAPDMVLLPSFQPLFEPWIDHLDKAGMIIGLHDGEGSPATGIDKYAASCMQDPALRGKVRFVTIWGSEMREHIERERVFPNAELAETGTMRYDFYAPQWRQAFLETTPELDQYQQPLVLINSHYPRGNPGPGFGTFEHIKKLLLERGYSQQGADDYIAESKRSFVALAELANQLAEKYPKATFIFRPHPFEELDTYRELLHQAPNLHLIRQGLIYGWLMRSQVVIHTGCLTGVEASFIGVPSLMPNWFAQILGNDESAALADPYDRPEDLSAALSRILDGSYQRPEQVEALLAEIVAKRFHSLDGESWQRHVEVMLRNLHQQTGGVDKEYCRGYLYGLNNGKGIKNWLGRLKRSWQAPPQWSLRGKSVSMDPLPERKKYDAEEARRMLEAIHRCALEQDPQSTPVRLRPADYGHGDYICPYWGHALVMEPDQGRV